MVPTTLKLLSSKWNGNGVLAVGQYTTLDTLTSIRVVTADLRQVCCGIVFAKSPSCRSSGFSQGHFPTVWKALRIKTCSGTVQGWR